MNSLSTANRSSVSKGILCVFSLLTGFSFWLNVQQFFFFLIFTALLPVIFYLVFFKKELFVPIIIFFVPLSVGMDLGGGTTADFPVEPLLGIMVLILSVYWIIKSGMNRYVFFNPVTILFVAGLLWMIICSAYGEFPAVSLKRCIVRASYIFIFYFLFLQWFLKKSSAKNNFFDSTKLFLIYGAGCLIPVFHGIYFHSQLHFAAVSAYLMPRPFFADHTIYGAALAFVLPMLLVLIFHAKQFSLSRWKAATIILLTVSIAAGEFFSFSRAAWISLGVAALFRLFIFLRIRFWMILIFLISGGIIVYQNYDSIIDVIKMNEAVSNKGDISSHLMSAANLQTDASNLERINRWKCALRMAEARPWIGFGPGSYQFIYGRYQVHSDMTRISTYHGTNGHAHSEIFNSLSEEGIPGMIIYLATMFAVIAYGLKIIYRSKKKQEKLIAIGALLGLITFYVHGFFNAFLDSDKMAILVFGSAALLASIGINQKKINFPQSIELGNS